MWHYHSHYYHHHHYCTRPQSNLFLRHHHPTLLLLLLLLFVLSFYFYNSHHHHHSLLYTLSTHIRTSTNLHNILRRSLSPGTSVAVISTTCSRAPFPFPLVGASSAFWFFSLPFFFFSPSLSSSSLGLFSHL